MLHGKGTTWFQTSRYYRVKVEFNLINLVPHNSSTTFETGLTMQSPAEADVLIYLHLLFGESNKRLKNSAPSWFASSIG